MLLVSKKFKYLASGTKHRALGLAHGQRVLRYRGAGVKNLYRLVDHAKLL